MRIHERILMVLILCGSRFWTGDAQAGKTGLAAKATKRGGSTSDSVGGGGRGDGGGDDHDNMHPEASLEVELYNKLLKNYSRRLRPVKDHSQPINVTVQMVLNQVVDLNEKEQTLTTQVWLVQYWYDEFVTWNETEYPGIKYLVVPSSKIWIPDVWVTNILGDTQVPVRELLDNEIGVEITPAGLVSYWLPIYMRTFCAMRLQDFPFDVQECRITVSSWMYDARQLVIVPDDDASKLDDYNPWAVSKQFVIKEFSHRPHLTKFPEDDRAYTYLYFKLVLERKAFFFIINLLLPCYLLALIACLSYLLPPDGGDRIALLVTVFLSIVVFVLVVLEIVPEESDTLPLFSKFLLGVMVLNMVQIIQAAFANLLHTSCTIRIPLPGALNKFLKCISCPKRKDPDAHPALDQNGRATRPQSVILTEQGNSIALNANDKDVGGTTVGVAPPGEADRMLPGADEGDAADAKPDYTEDWKRFFLCLDKLCFVVLVVLITFVFFYMVYYR